MTLLPVSTSSRKRCIGHLLFDPFVGASWAVWLVATCASAIVLVRYPAIVSNARGAAATSSNATSSIAEGRQVEPIKRTESAAHVGTPKHASPSGILLVSSLIVGYTFWSLYWGIPPWVKLTAKGYERVPKALVGIIGCSTLILLIVPVLLIAMGYSVFGGGIFHFLRRWWLLCHPKDMAIETRQLTPTQSAAGLLSYQRLEDLESRLRKLDELYWNGLITRDEYESRRTVILHDAG